MKAKTVSENINYKRGSDPKDSMGLGLKEWIYKAMHRVAMNPYVMGMETREDADSDKVFLKIKYVGSFESDWKEEVNEYLGKYVKPETTPGVGGFHYFEIHPEYVQTFRSILREDASRGVNENVNFRRGQDPRKSMGIGVYKDGYKIDKFPDFDDWEQGSNNLLDWDQWDWDKKAYHPDEVGQTPVTPILEKDLLPLPVVTFEHFFDELNPCGLFGNWPSDFPFNKIPFIANVEEDGGRSFLVSPEGYDYPRWITELV